MKKIVWTSLIISIVISSAISNLGTILQNFEEYDENPPLGLSNSDSWSKIVKEEDWFYTHYCELVNGSLYIIGMPQWWDYTNPYLYVSKFNTSGIKEWELSIKLAGGHFSSYIFDNCFRIINTNILRFRSSTGIAALSSFAIPSLATSLTLVICSGLPWRKSVPLK